MKSIRLAFARGSKQAVFSEIGGNIAEIHISFLHSQSEMSRNNPARCGWLEPPSSPPVPDVDTVPTPVDYQQLTNDMVCLRLSLSSGERGPVYWPHKSLAVEENDHVILCRTRCIRQIRFNLCC